MTRAFLMTAGLMAGAVGPAAAQHDFRGLDAGRPLQVSDAYPVEFLEFEWQMGVTGNMTEDDGQTVAVLGLEFGFARNWELSVDLEGSWIRTNGSSSTGVEGMSAHVLFNPNQEGRTTPALALQAGITTPGFGDTGRTAAAAEIAAMATRTFGSFRLHLNGGYEWISMDDGADEWFAALGTDRALGLSGRLVAADVVVEAPIGEDTRVLAEVGMRFQTSRTLVFDVGLGSRLDEWTDGRPHIAVTVGLSRGFGIAAFMGGLTYPDPRIN